MGRGLSKLQKWVLVEAFANRITKVFRDEEYNSSETHPDVKLSAKAIRAVAPETRKFLAEDYETRHFKDAAKWIRTRTDPRPYDWRWAQTSWLDAFEEPTDLLFAEIKARFYGLAATLGRPRGASIQVFEKKRLANYAVVSRSVSLAIKRLERRGLVYRCEFIGRHGIELTDHGFEIAGDLFSQIRAKFSAN